jgi:xanthine dehydrogenase accessory factor
MLWVSHFAVAEGRPILPPTTRAQKAFCSVRKKREIDRQSHRDVPFMLELIEEILRRTDAGETLAVCMVAATRGSTPQKAGATMLVLRDGQTLGTLGGGCVEAEVRTRALSLIESAQDRILTFQLNHDYGWDDGLVCGGTMDIAIKVVSAETAPFRQALAQLGLGREATLEFEIPDESNALRLVRHTFLPPPRLVIAGAGHVGSALANLAPSMGFEVTLIDDRADLVSPQRFPNARCIAGEIDLELQRLEITPHTYIVIVTRGHRHDAQSLAAVIHSNARYIGLIGSRRKVVTIFQTLMEQGVSMQQLQRVRAPIGLAIGAITPGEIAVSIAAELVAVRRGIHTDTIRPMKLPEHLLHRTQREKSA